MKATWGRRNAPFLPAIFNILPNSILPILGFITSLAKLSKIPNISKLGINVNPLNNPYAPGAGTLPPELAGRNAIREKTMLCINRLRLGKPAKSVMLIGLRGVGKTVLLEAQDASDAIVKPAQGEGVEIDDDAVASIMHYTQGYPYFLQKWGKHAWDIALTSPISRTDVEAASIEAIATLDESFFRMRFDRLTPGEKKYLRALVRQSADKSLSRLAFFKIFKTCKHGFIWF